MLCVSQAAFALEIPANLYSNTATMYYSVDWSAVTEHIPRYDIEYTFDSFAYTFSGAYETDTSGTEITASNITGKWTKNTATLTVTCKEGSDAIELACYFYESTTNELPAITSYDGDETYSTVTVDKIYTKDSEKLLKAGESESFIYTIEGEIPSDKEVYNSVGGTFDFTKYVGNENVTSAERSLFDVCIYISDAEGMM